MTIKKIFQIRFSIYFAIIFNALCFPYVLLAEDIETMLATNSQPPDPKILFVFDTSGSMSLGVPGSSSSRMSIAKEALLNLVHDTGNSDLDIGLMLFNRNSSSSNDGGRVVFRLQDMDSTSLGAYPDSYTHSNAVSSCCSSSRKGVCSWSSSSTPSTSTLTRQICDMYPDGSTPLEETLTEAYRYFAGDINVKYGNENDGRAKDSSAEDSDGTYKSPILEDVSFIKEDYNSDGSITIDDLQCEQAYIVYMTDGEPTNDTNSHSFVDGLSGVSCTSSSSGSCMDEMAGYMFDNDLDDNSALNDIQKIITYTIGFTTNQTLLENTATKGGGKYFTANNASELNQYFNAIFAEINATSASFTAPGVGSAVGSDARSLNYIYYSFFTPSDTPNWLGNLKKYRLALVNDILTVVDANGNTVFDSVSGQFNDGIISLWTDQQTGAPVDKDVVNIGGAGASITSHSTRTIKTNTGTSNTLQTFNTSNANITQAMLGASSTTERDNIINWARGRLNDSGHSDLTSVRWSVGDPLHSKPVIINYGKRNGISTYAGTYQDIRIMVGTNGGFLHMFKDDLGGAANNCSVTKVGDVCPTSGYTTGDTVSESWAFIPKEVASILKTLKTNAGVDPHPYGVDSTVGLYRIDNNNDGNICSTVDCDADGSPDNDSVTIVFGLRRGGGYYYAIDVTDPDNPVFKWQFSHAEISQSWSKPQFGQVRYDRVTSGTPAATTQTSKHVAVFAAGYDTNKDTEATIGTADSKGRGLFILDMDNGNIIWSVLGGSGTNTSTLLYESGLVDSVTASPTLVYSDSDEFIDRIYFPDLGGNVWRVDLYTADSTQCGSPTPCDRTTWNIHKFANLGRHDGTASLASDRRFFYRIDHVKTRDSKGNYDALILGSGHRNNPLETATDNRIYMLKEKVLTTYKYQSTVCENNESSILYEADCRDSGDYSTLTNSNLVDTSTTAIGPTDNGWRLSLGTTAGTRAKVMGSASTIEGKVFITTFQPGAATNNLCTITSGSKAIYALDLQTSNAVFDTNQNDEVSEVDRRITIHTTGLPSDLPVHFGSDDSIRVIPKEPFDTGSDIYTKTFFWYKGKN